MEGEDLVAQLELIVVGAVGLTARALAEAAPGTELTFPQWRALLVLGADPAGARLSEVAARVGVTLPATSRLLRRLERRGFITLTADEHDRRATRARLAPRGDEVRAAILAYQRAFIDEIAGRTGNAGRGSAGSAIEPLADAFGSFA